MIIKRKSKPRNKNIEKLNKYVKIIISNTNKIKDGIWRNI